VVGIGEMWRAAAKKELLGPRMMLKPTPANVEVRPKVWRVGLGLAASQ
jgi:hypothetical protein